MDIEVLPLGRPRNLANARLRAVPPGPLGNGSERARLNGRECGQVGIDRRNLKTGRPIRAAQPV